MRSLFLSLAFVVGAHSFAAPALKPESVRDAAAYSRSHRGLSLLIIQNGRVIFEEYPNGNAAGVRLKIFSGTKGFWAVAAMAAAHDGILRLDEKVSDTISEWRSDPQKERITVRQLLSFTSGLDPAFHLHRDGFADRNAVAIHTPLAGQPGSVFTYGPSHLQVFNELLRRKLATRETPVAYIQRRVLAPMRIGALEFKKDGSGNPLLASGFKLSAREWSRMGALILNEGSYDGCKIAPSSLLEECFSGSSVNPAFGMGFWVNKLAPSGREIGIEDELELNWRLQNWKNGCICRNAPPDLIVSLGSCCQRLYVIRSQKLIVVRQGVDSKFSDAAFLRLLLGSK